MKYLILILTTIFILLFGQSYAQRQDGENVPNPQMDKFAGTWIWSSGTDTLKIVIKKENFAFTGNNYTADRIIGFHQYKKGNTIIESSMANQHTHGPDEEFSILAYGTQNNGKELFGNIDDITKSRVLSLVLTINTAGNRLVFAIKERPGPHVNDPNFKNFTLPNNITLKKEVLIPDVE